MIKDGSKVSIHYTLTVEGEVVDSSQGREPLNYKQGSGQIIPGLENQLVGLKQGEKKSVDIVPEDAYGPHQSEAVQTVPRQAFEDSKHLKVGDLVNGEFQDQTFQATITAVSDEEIILDMNHPLAGKTLHFDIEVITVE